MLAALWLTLSASAGSLQTIAQLDPDFLVTLLRDHPELAMSQAQIDASAARLQQARRTPVSGVQIGIGLEDPFAPDATLIGGSSPMLSGKLWLGVNPTELLTYSARVREARQERASDIAQRDLRRRLLEEELHRTWLEIRSLQETLQIRQEALEVMAGNRTVGEHDFLAGSMPMKELTQLIQFELTARITLQDTQQSLERSILHLEMLIGCSLEEAMAAQEAL